MGGIKPGNPAVDPYAWAADKPAPTAGMVSRIEQEDGTAPFNRGPADVKAQLALIVC
jgi:hypothetical protein